MSLSKPIIESISAFDATENHIFYFNSIGGDQVVKNEIKIERRVDDNNWEDAYTNVLETYNNWQTVPSDTLTNGEVYRYSFRVYNASDEYSDFSIPSMFYCYTNPTIEVNIEDGQVVNSGTFDFQLTYNQQEGELFDFCVISLYEDDELFKTTDYLFSEGTPPSNINYRFSGLLEDKQYKLKYRVVTIHKTEIISEFINFTVVYEKPTLYSTLIADPQNCDGYIDIASNIVALNGIANPEEPIYIDNDMVDLISCDYDIDHENTTYWVKWNQGFSVPSETMLLRLWFYPSTINGNLFKLSNENGDYLYAKLVRGETDDYVVIDANNGLHLTSNNFTHTNGNEKCFLWLRNNNGEYQLSCEVLDSETSVFEWNSDDNNMKYNTTMDITFEEEDFENYTPTEDVETLLNAQFTEVKIGNGLYDHINISKDMDIVYTTTIPTKFEMKTILDCNFANNINGGSSNVEIQQLNYIRIKRKDEFTNSWITIYERTINSQEDLNVSIKDMIVPSNVEQTYAIVPVLNGGIEGDYITTNATPKWKYTFITDGTQIFKLNCSVSYDTITQNIPIGVLSPIGAVYPTVIQNSENNYRSGSMQAQLFGYNFNGSNIDRLDVVRQTNDFIKFISNGKTKVLLDWNGNNIIFKLMSSPTMSYNASYGNGITTVAFSWVEQGKYNNQDDLENNNLINV